MAHLEDRWIRKDKTHTPLYGKGLRWRVIWEEPGGARRTKSFRNRDAAKAFLTSMDHRVRSGEYVPPEDARKLLEDFWPRLERLKSGRAKKTRDMYGNAWRNHLAPVWGHKQVRAIRGPAFSEWLETLDLSASGKTKVKQTMAALLNLAVDDKVIPRNPLVGVRVRKDPPRDHLYLTPAQVAGFLESITPHYRLLAETLVSTGIRVGEAVELRVGDLDLGKARIRVSRGWADGEVSTPKSRRSRAVPVPAPLVTKLSVHVRGRGGEDLVFTSPQGRRVDRRNFKNRHVVTAARKAGLPEGFRTHDLRHTFASLAISAGANVKAVQNAMGHADATTTLRTYAGLFDRDLDDVATRLGDILGNAGTPREHLTEPPPLSD